MTSKRLALILITVASFWLLPHNSSAQAGGEYWELGFFGGASHYYGDLQEEFIHSNELHPSVGVFLRYSPSHLFSIRSGLYYGRISGSDENSSNRIRRYRNLSFRSNIFEFSAIAEWNILGLNFRTTTNQNITPYVFAGVGVFRFNPQAHFNDEWVNLQPLSTEGQGLLEYAERHPYSRTQLSIPHGVGLKIQLSHKFLLAFEIAPRYTFTDYLDDVSTTHVDPELLRQHKGDIAVLLSDRSWEVEGVEEPLAVDGANRGNPETNDWYVFFGVSLSINLNTNHCSY